MQTYPLATPLWMRVMQAPKNFSFTVSLSETLGSNITIDYASSDGSAATTDNDYVSTSGTLTIPAGSLSGTIQVTVNGDSKFETNETFDVVISNPSSGNIIDNTGTGTITNDDTTPVLTIYDTSGNEGTDLSFTVSLNNTSYQTITVNYQSNDGIATVADNDYTAIPLSTLTFLPGDISKTITINSTADTKYESNETLTIKLSGISNATFGDDTGTGTINNEDALPAISINNVAADEGNGISFAITLDHASYQNLTVDYMTTDVNATTADNDYTGISTSTLTFAAGETSKNITVNTTSDTKYETDETFELKLSNPINATIADNTGTGTITNDDPQPVITINDVTTAEGSALAFTVSLSRPSYQDITVNYATADGSATAADADFTAIASTSLTFLAGETSKTITVNTTTDTKFELDEDFQIKLSGAVNATITDDTGIGTITNNDTQPAISINNTLADEGNNLTFTVSLNHASYQTITVNYSTTDGTAKTSDNDYTGIGSTTLTFLPGEINKSITVITTTDNKFETDETLDISLSGALNASLNNTTGTGTITNEDSQPSISINNVTANEGNSLNFTVSLNHASYQTIAVNYATANGTATTSDNDYIAIASTTLTFLSGETSKTVTVSTTTDNKYEQNETLDVNLSGETNATLAIAKGVGTISNNDNLPEISISDNSVPEGSNLSFSVTLSNPSDQIITVDYSTSNGTATDTDNDYTAIASTTLTFAASETNKTITVLTTGDTKYEQGEYMQVDLTNPVNATIGSGSATGTILNNDGLPQVVLSLSSLSFSENAGSASVIATLNRTSYQNVLISLTFNGTAGNTTDFTVASTTITVPAGSTSASATITAIEDAIVEGNETIIIDISGVTNGSENGTQQVTATILDNDIANYIPDAIDDFVVVNEDNNVSTNVTNNDTGLGDGGITVNVTSGPAHGNVLVSGSIVSYTPDPNYHGSDSYTYRVCDTDNECDVATVNITVNSVDDTPIAIADALSLNEDASASLNVTANDNGLGDGGLTVTILSSPSHGSVSISGTSVTYTPVANYSGTDTYTYRVCDSDNDCSGASVAITINSVNDSPVAVADNISVNEDGSAGINVTTNDTGLGDGGLTVTITADASHGTTSVAGSTVTYTPAANYHGNDNFTYRICDGDGDCSSSTVAVTVSSVNDLPLATADNITVNEDGNTITNVTANDNGLGDGNLTLSVTTGPAHGSVSISGTSVTYTPNPDYYGPDSYVYRICDGESDCSSATVNVTVNSIDDIPVAGNENLSLTEDGNITANLIT
ncbi:MAG: tandem-95 repeat protein, partial [Bacteroidales bacterium]|nr:tandem-95 repeat protein [Bacteroidales bacterium]